jgi:hypothetical protein
MVYANISSEELGFPGKPRMLWAPARADSPANESMTQVLVMAGPKRRRTKFVKYVWPYHPNSAAVLRSRGAEVLGDQFGLL